MRTEIRNYVNSEIGTYPDRTVFTGVTVSKVANSDIVTITGALTQTIPPFSRIKVADDDNDFDYREIKEVSQDGSQIILTQATLDAMTDVPLIILMAGKYGTAQLLFNFQDGACVVNRDYANGSGSDGEILFPCTFHNGFPMVIDPTNGNATLVVENIV